MQLQAAEECNDGMGDMNTWVVKDVVANQNTRHFPFLTRATENAECSNLDEHFDAYQASLRFDKWTIHSVHFVVQTTGVTEVVSGTITAPKWRGNSPAVYTFSPLNIGKIFLTIWKKKAKILFASYNKWLSVQYQHCPFIIWISGNPAESHMNWEPTKASFSTVETNVYLPEYDLHDVFGYQIKYAWLISSNSLTFHSAGLLFLLICGANSTYSNSRQPILFLRKINRKTKHFSFFISFLFFSISVSEDSFFLLNNDAPSSFLHRAAVFVIFTPDVILRNTAPDDPRNYDNLDHYYDAKCIKLMIRYVLSVKTVVTIISTEDDLFVCTSLPRVRIH